MASATSGGARCCVSSAERVPRHPPSSPRGASLPGHRASRACRRHPPGQTLSDVQSSHRARVSPRCSVAATTQRGRPNRSMRDGLAQGEAPGSCPGPFLDNLAQAPASKSDQADPARSHSR
jgi:hypothetical protein